VSDTSAPRTRARLGAHELTNLDERLGLLLLVRIGMVGLVFIGAIFAAHQVDIGVAHVAPISAGYLLLAVFAEWYRRSQLPGRLLLHRIILPLDAVYLVLVTTPSGGPRSQLVLLFAIQIIAVTLLVSPRAGIRIALWDSFLFVLVPTLSLSHDIGTMEGVSGVSNPPAPETVLAIVGFWVVALCTAFFSSVSERELRRSKVEMTALADMAAELEHTQRDDEILSVLLRTLVATFPFTRGALWWLHGDRGEGLVLPRAGDEVAVARVLPGAAGDRVAFSAWANREPQLVRRLTSADDPAAAALLPDAKNVVVLPLEIDGHDSGIVLLEHGGNPITSRLPKGTLLALTQFASHAALSLRNARLLAERERQAAIDGLTGLANRREFDQVLPREVSRVERTGEPLSLVVFDVDHFKKINDTHGHLAGDEVLRAIGNVLADAVRDMDLVARYGGEEFAVILPRCDQGDAIHVVERVSGAMRDDPRLEGVTISAGVATMPLNATDGLALIAAADGALYESKRSGRNRYTLAPRPMDPARAKSSGSV
jgi:diguanylate cyclase (GGDEF)-like protein